MRWNQVRLLGGHVTPISCGGRQFPPPPPWKPGGLGAGYPRDSALDPERLPRHSPNGRAPRRAAAGTPGLSPEGDPGPVAQPSSERKKETISNPVSCWFNIRCVQQYPAPSF